MSSTAFIEVAGSNGYWGSSNQLNDLLMRTSTAAQQIWLGTNSNLGLTLSNNVVSVRDTLTASNVNVSGGVFVNGANVTSLNSYTKVGSFSNLNGVAAVTFSNLTGINYVLQIGSVQPMTSGAVLCVQTSSDNGATWSSSYGSGLCYRKWDTAILTNFTSGSNIPLTGAVGGTTIRAMGTWRFTNLNLPEYVLVEGIGVYVDTGNAHNTAQCTSIGQYAANALKVYWSTGNFAGATGRVTLYNLAT
jgi:hypothetical protein